MKTDRGTYHRDFGEQRNVCSAVDQDGRPNARISFKHTGHLDCPSLFNITQDP
jgi:hypothetical protein